MMNYYYTAKDLEELASKGLTQLELGPNDSLTDFARETAEQQGIEIVQQSRRTQSETPGVSLRTPGESMGTKPKGCQHGPINLNQQAAPIAKQNSHSGNASSSGVVDRLVDIVDGIMNRGG